MMKKMKILIIILLIIFIAIIGIFIFKSNFSNNGKMYKEVTVEEFENIATKNGYYFIESSYNENLDENEMPDEISDFSVGFRRNEKNELQYKIEFYEFKDQEKIEKYYNQAIERFKTWNDEEKTINEDIGDNYKKCEIINQYGYGIVVSVDNTLFMAYGYEEELKELIRDLYE